MSIVGLWTGLNGAGHNCGEPPVCHPGDSPSKGMAYVAHLPGRYLALADVCVSAFRLGHGPLCVGNKG